MTQTLIEQLEKLPRHTDLEALYESNGDYVLAEDLRAIIEQHKSEAVEPVARVTALSNLGFSTMGQVEWIGNKYSLSPDALLYAAPQPDHTKLIGELAQAIGTVLEGYTLHDSARKTLETATTKAREAIK